MKYLRKTGLYFLKKTIRNLKVRLNNKPKIFCIGRNKTGTTSLRTALEDFGYIVGDQAEAELLLHDYKRRDFKKIIEYCRTAEVFQDIPFSLPYTFIVLDYSFPKSKFILTVRDSAEEWYESFIRFQSKTHGKGSLPTKEDLQNAEYRYRGFAWDTKEIVFNVSEDNIYEEAHLKEHYNFHNKMVQDYFRFRRDDLLVLNLKDDNAYRQLCSFLDHEPLYDEMPWKNRTD